MSWLPTGLRGRLVITFTLVAITASAMVAGLGYHLVRRELLGRAERTDVADVRDTLSSAVLPIGLGDVVWPNGPAVTDDDLAALARSLSGPGRTVIMTYGGSRYVSPGSRYTLTDVPGPFRELAGRRLAYQHLSIRHEPLLLVGSQIQRVNRSGTQEATGLTAYVFFSLADEEGVLVRLRNALAQAGGITLTIALTGALLSARRVLLPVRRLGVAARALGSGDLRVRLPVRGRDELAELTATFNETAAALEQTVSELRTLESMSRRFVADVSHELRTPLTAMTAVTDMLAEDASRLPGDAGEAILIVIREIERLRVLVEHLIEISRFDAGAVVLRKERVDVGVALADALEVRGWAGQVKLTTPVGLRFSVDSRRFDVIVANLVGNALNHGLPPVEVRAEVIKGELVISVRDHGEGIPEHALPHVFDRFFKAGSGRARSGGSGLGLAIAKANAELHDGTLTVERCTPGTLFRLRIPRS
ncbi:two-component sensor histidine kinase [Planotetraspora thailandica]|uniref:histidine kinase n=1 Tax=Planotetraspora thailandica TaxID=487172 RepID=A0A8J3UYG8_9ACTN|nr:HAMP domain-containing sensor histidine kinase [Planotetraspora thailandica]GII52975.1 two-component sensor histidine kinase [Planotetraspora thailandica]